MSGTATAIAHPTIAFIKYWGNRAAQLTLPANGSISMNLAGLETHTTVCFDPELKSDELLINDQVSTGDSLVRVSSMLSRIRQLAVNRDYAQVVSRNNIPTGAGIASSASAFAALAVAASFAAGLELDQAEVSRLARTGSGSACRSVPGGFVEWYPGQDHHSSYAASIAPPEHWRLEDHVVVVSRIHKATSSLRGHSIAHTSSLQAARVSNAPQRLDICRKAILERDFSSLAEVVELDSNLMHTVMMTSSPRLIYWQPETVHIMQAVQEWRTRGIKVCYTIDAGPNVHLLCPQEDSPEVLEAVGKLAGEFTVLSAVVGGPASLVSP